MKILSPAKINLFLHVTGKRPDGYHELVTLMSCISLYDVMTFDFEAPGISVRCGSPNVPDNEANLAFKAASLFYDRLSAVPGAAIGSGGVSIFIEKHIPVAAGLGGGSSNAGRTLLQLNQYHGWPFSAVEMNRMGLAIGADVPFFLQEKPAVATGIGESLKVYSGLQVLPIVVACPDIPVSTAAVYKKLNLGLTKCGKKLKNFFSDKSAFNVDQYLCNDLETVAIPKYPVISDIKRQLLQLGAHGALMSGSGPAVFGIYSDLRKARRACELLSEHHRWRLFVAETVI
ncbi:MAG: 4-(cytidine 5'-diphospho)-2-C-methyl-D-erythritol kinase [Desulfobacterales bacterium]|nr:4-(cytidine 5'-diphospho)-2-C-methyl-D-erythritol kinase [Desulfobacterales bacterium]MDX2511900.1 4-(cytidine 5'-diphospho)-2-C-methyl-D-erythritol kinase [Desulfobacterales bacterium]